MLAISGIGGTMRQSKYTVVVEEPNGEHLLYNTANGAFAVADDEAYGDYCSCSGTYASALMEDGFLTDLAPDQEVAAQKAYFEAQRSDHSGLMLVLAPTYACNLRCPYCYEQGHNAIKGKMSEEVMDAVLRFVEARYAENHFERLDVEWYGGDPSLALDVVEELSSRLIAWCDERGVAYDAMMLTNCNLIDEAAVQMLVRSRLSSVYVTIDGFEDMHNARRVSAVGLNSFQKNVEAVKLFAKYGVKVSVAMNVDRVNWPEYHPLRDWLREQAGVELMPARLCDYGHFYGSRGFEAPAFDLFDHDEFCRMTHEEFVAGGFDAQTIADLLHPVPRFCNGQRDDYFVIDTVGDVYYCDGVIGEKDHIKFNVKDEPTYEQLHGVSHDPHDSPQCRACHLLPICQGNCDWERRATNMVCHPLLTTLPDYLRDYRSCFDVDPAPYVRLA